MGSKAKILVVDDEPGILDLLTRVFETNGYQVDTAKNGSAAIAKGKKKSYPLALIDIVMPGMNGLETFAALNKINPKIKAVMITGYAVPDLIREALASGAYACVKKPFQIKKLLTLIGKALKTK